MRHLSLLFVLSIALGAAERPVDPTFLYRNLSEAPVGESGFSAEGCEYRPLFGEGDAHSSILRGVSRYGELTIAPGRRCEEVSYERQEEIFYVLEGEGAATYRGELYPIRKGDFLYFPPTAKHTALNDADSPLRLIVMGFHIPEDVEQFGVPVKLPIAHESEAKKQVVGNHPPTTLYQLLLGGADSRRDLLAVGHTVTSLFLMEFAPGGTNHPHHHLLEEEIYLVLAGEGEIVAGGGTDGVEGRRPAKPGDAYYYRPNATVGFYADEAPADPEQKAIILAVRSDHPRR